MDTLKALSIRFGERGEKRVAEIKLRENIGMKKCNCRRVVDEFANRVDKFEMIQGGFDDFGQVGF